MEFLVVIVPFVIAVVLGKLLLPYIFFITYKKRLFDPVDSRKLHFSIIPRLGGVAFVPVQCCLLAITVVAIYKVPFLSQSFNLNIHTVYRSSDKLHRRFR